MSGESLGTVAASEGIGRVEVIGEVDCIRFEDLNIMPRGWAVNATDVRVSIVEVQMTGTDDLVGSKTDAPRSTTIAPPTGGSLSRKPGPPLIYKDTPSGRLPRPGQPILLDRPVRLARSPATHLVSGLKWLLTPKAYSRIVEPLVAQEQHEYFEAIRRGDQRLARWIVARMYALIICNAMWALVAPIAKMFRSAT